MSTVASTLLLIQQSFIRYGFPVILTLGNIGNLLCVAMFLQKHHRQSPISMYLLAAAIFSLFGVNWGVATNINAVYRPPDVFSLSSALCRTRGYIMQTSTVLYRTMIVLACVSRAASSSTRLALRNFNKPRTAMMTIGLATLFWLALSVHLPIFQESRSGRCNVFGSYAVFFSIYQICILGVISPGLMIIFSLIILRNLKASRRRVQPSDQTNRESQKVLNKRDRNLLKLLFTEVLASMTLTSLYPITLLYTVLSASVADKSPDRLQIEVFVAFISLNVLLHMNYSITFYMYVVASKPFRQEAKRLFQKPINLLQRYQTRLPSLRTNNQAS